MFLASVLVLVRPRSRAVCMSRKYFLHDVHVMPFREADTHNADFSHYLLVY